MRDDVRSSSMAASGRSPARTESSAPARAPGSRGAARVRQRSGARPSCGSRPTGRSQTSDLYPAQAAQLPIPLRRPTLSRDRVRDEPSAAPGSLRRFAHRRPSRRARAGARALPRRDQTGSAGSVIVSRARATSHSRASWADGPSARGPRRRGCGGADAQLRTDRHADMPGVAASRGCSVVPMANASVLRDARCFPI